MSASGELRPRRLYLHEPGWEIGHKQGSEREFCYTMAPGQSDYHRLYAGELYLFNSEERLCVACAERRGLLSYRPLGLRDPVGPLTLEPGGEALEVVEPDDDEARP